jgi:hypothetical protein
VVVSMVLVLCFTIPWAQGHARATALHAVSALGCFVVSQSRREGTFTHAAWALGSGRGVEEEEDEAAQVNGMQS